MKLLYIIIILGLLQTAYAGDPLEQLIGKSVRFEAPTMTTYGGSPYMYDGTVIGVSYPFVEIRYLNGEVHILNSCHIHEVLGDLPNMIYNITDYNITD